ncbi:hypothetical protein LTS18_003295, partial [Coniosporium uncinatum]
MTEVTTTDETKVANGTVGQAVGEEAEIAEASAADETWEWEEDQNKEPPKWRADTGRGTYQA